MTGHLQSISSYLLISTLLIASIMGFTSLPANADIVVMTDGRTLRGEILEETKHIIKFRFSLNGIWTTQNIDRRDIDTVYKEDGDQSDMAEAAEEESNDNSNINNPGKKERRDPSIPLVAIIPLHGQVGGTVENSLNGTFDATVIEKCFKEAEENGADLVVLDINSPGGLVSEMEAICETILNWQDRLRIVAWPNEAYSAAAIITMCCKEIYVRPDSLIGAATIVQVGGNKVNALDAKMASPHYAKQRQYMQKSGHPYEVVAAMTIMETRLWWSENNGFVTDQPTNLFGWSAVDGATTILTMTAEDAVKWSIAEAKPLNFNGVLTLTGISHSAEKLNLEDTIKRHNRNLEIKLISLKKNFTNYFGAIIQLSNHMKDYFEAVKQKNYDYAKTVRSKIPRDLGKIRSAGSQIEKSDRSALARRIAIPETFVDQINDDRALLSRISRLLEDETVEGWNEAAERLNAVIKSWREILNL